MRLLLFTAAALTAAGCSFIVDVDSVRAGRDAGGEASLVADRTGLDFGSIPVGEASPPATVRISNLGTGVAGELTAEIGGAGATMFPPPDLSGCVRLEPGQSCEVPLTFAPGAAQTFAATITLRAAPGGTIVLPVTGEGVVPGALSISPPVVDFGSVVKAGFGAAVTFTVENTGDVPTGALSVQVTGADQLHFELTQDGCAGQTLPPAATCDVQARFAPGGLGPRRATLTVAGAPGGTAVSTLIGAGLLPGDLGLAPTSRTFPSIPAGTQGAPLTFQIANDGTSPTGPVTLNLSGGSAQDFEILSTTCAPDGLPPTASCAAQVRFVPRTPGLQIATLVATASPGGSATAALSAIAQKPAALAASPPAVDYGTVVTIAPVTATIIVENTGGVASGLLTPALSGGDVTLFAITSNGCAAPLEPGAQCALAVTFAPTSAGMKKSSLVVSASPGGAVTLPLVGAAVTPGAIDLSPKQTTFGDVVQGSASAPTSFVIANTGGSATSPLAVALGGTNADQFTVGSDGCSGAMLEAGASCVVTVIFAPVGSGPMSASLAVSATVGGTSAASLTGLALAQAALSVLPTSASFNAQVAGQVGDVQSFSVKNSGDVPTGAALTVSLGGADPDSFSTVANTCAAAPLAAGASCSVSVQFTPPVNASGPKSAIVSVMPQSGAGGVASASMTGTALTPASLSLDDQAFGPAPIGAVVDRTFTVTNGGGGAATPLTLSISGPNAGDFQVLAAATGDCVSGVSVLAGGAACTVRIRWNAGGRGPRSALLTVTANVGGSDGAVLTGTGQQEATLIASSAPLDFKKQEYLVASAPLVWTITNSGDLPSGTPALGPSGADVGDFAFTTTCTAPLAAGQQCTVTVTFKPTLAGQRTAQLTALASPGGTVSVPLSGGGQARITVATSGTGTVTSSPAGISCPGTCTALFDLASVALTATTTNGSGHFMTGWTGACIGPARTCQVISDTSKSATATFTALTNNVVFVSSTDVSRSLGALANYDALCNSLASNAGINNGTNSAFIALMSNSTTPAPARFASGVHGFVRVDGKPIFDQLSDALWPTLQLYHPLNLDELGRRVSANVVTATLKEGNAMAAVNSCNDWTSNASSAGYGFGTSALGPALWIHDNNHGCHNPGRIYCFMNTRTDALTVPLANGKRIWLSGALYTPGSGVTPDAHCQSQKPSSVTTARALISTTTSEAAAALNPAQTYVRPDGQVVGTYAEIVAATTLRTGIWQLQSGAYVSWYAWTGYAGALTNKSGAGTTCTDWTTSSGTGHVGTPYSVTQQWWARISNQPCTSPQALICVEQ